MDTYAEVCLNDDLILNANNMFREWEIECKDLLNEGSNKLEIKFRNVFGVNPIDCTKYDRVLDRINTPRGEKGSCHEIQEVHSGI